MNPGGVDRPGITGQAFPPEVRAYDRDELPDLEHAMESGTRDGICARIRRSHGLSV